MALEFFSQKKDQGVVSDQEKARDMAETEDEYRELAAAFKDYMEDPVAYRHSEDERVQRVADDGAFTTSDANDYMELYREGVRPRDLEALGEQMAEMHGAQYDFAKEVQGSSGLSLRIMIAWLKLEQHLAQKTFNKAIAQVDFGADEQRSYIVTHLLNQLEAGDEHAGIAERVHQVITHDEHLQELAEAELERRKNGMGEGVAA